MSDADVIIIGAGIAGSSVAAFLAARADTLILEAEPFPGYHTTGRSAAFFSESYGGPAIQPLSLASKPFFFTPPQDFSDVALVRARGAVHVAQAHQQHRIGEMLRDYGALAPALSRLEKRELDQLAPMLKPDWAVAALHDPDCQDMDVGALHQGYLRKARLGGARLVVDAQVTALSRQADRWRVATRSGIFTAPVVVNAAGAWSDHVAALAGLAPVGLQPLRRTIITFTPQGMDVDPRWPLVLDIDELFYFKPEGKSIWASPADETPEPAGDVQPDELTVALAASRVESATRFVIPRLNRRWAGLRTFMPDRIPVYGFDSRAAGFFWCAGQGGFGIQTSAAAGQLCAALLCHAAVPDSLLECGVTPAHYDVARVVGR